MQSIEELKYVPIELIRTNQSQPRRHFARDEIASLAASIKAVGLIHPPIVQELSQGEGYELIAGERRVRAAKEAGLSAIKVLVRKGNPSLSAQLALIENVQRVDLNPLEIARSLQKLVEEFGLTQRELARCVAKKRSTIANYLRLLTLPKQIQLSLQTGKISMGHAKAILSIECPKQQEVLHQEIIRRHLNVRQTESAAKGVIQAKDETVHLKALENKIQYDLGVKTELRGKGAKGQLIFHYEDLDELDKILAHLKVSAD
jgi:ParB family chromosome partitioning protein